MAGDPLDLELVRRARAQGGSEAFTTLVKRYERPLYNFLLRSLRNAALAEEHFQETFLRCCRGLSDFDPDEPGANFKAWVYRIAVNLVRDEVRKPAFQRALQLEQELGLDAEADRAPSPEDQASWAQQRARVRRAVTCLPEQPREVVILHQYQGLSYPEIAQALDIPLGTVKSRMHAALVELRKVLVDDGDEASAAAAGVAS
ncbi:MAG TPA: sigma-70 family RNA polymerase sigma factor [Myxococcales bacterium]|jgi:RNA polymerase sigma-70 factor (ECF subfamily)